MITTVIGLHGHFTDLCRDICADVLAAIGAAPAVLELESSIVGHDLHGRPVTQLSRIAAESLRLDAQGLLVVSRVPGRDFVVALENAAKPYFVMQEDPRSVVLTLVGFGIDARTAVRMVGASCAAIVDLAGRSQARTFRRDDFEPEMLSTALHEVLGLARTDETADIVRGAISRRLPSLGRESRIPNSVSERLKEDLGAALALTVEAALSGYTASLRGRSLSAIIATRNMFLTSESPDKEVPAAIDITGRSRCLAFGPYMFLPSGKWILRLTLAFSPDAAGSQFFVDVTASQDNALVELGKVAFSAFAGRYVAQITFMHIDPSSSLEFRLSLDSAAFDGKVSVGYADLQRIEDTSAEIGEAIDWNAELVNS